ncbi:MULTISPECIES: FecR family protein [unclassified Nitrospina]|uniref:FecR family protein n=1 Tax=unclassified Nitrospina TaxID=2638683 RepID=UPI003F96898C
MSDPKKKLFSHRFSFPQRRLFGRALDFWLKKNQSAENQPSLADDYENWKKEKPDHARAGEDLEQFLDSPELHAALQKAKRERLDTKQSPGLPVSYWQKAAWGVIAASALLLVLPIQQWIHFLKADYVTEVGKQFRSSLPDGSTMILNTDTAVRVSFTQDQRTVHLLKGEALFQVVSNPNRPFRVVMDHQQLTVVGTRFIARSWEETEEALVLEGKVHAQGLSEPAGPGHLLTAGVHLVRTPHRGTSLYKSEGSPAWLTGHIVFNATPLPLAIDELDRYLPQSLFLIGDSLNDKRITAAYHLNKIESNLDVLARTLNISILRMGPVILFY